jgi:hypothetical protein
LYEKFFAIFFRRGAMQISAAGLWRFCARAFADRVPQPEII